jgi:hypothetical protein
MNPVLRTVVENCIGSVTNGQPIGVVTIQKRLIRLQRKLPG